MRVEGWKTWRRNESKIGGKFGHWSLKIFLLKTSLLVTLLKGSNYSIKTVLRVMP